MKITLKHIWLLTGAILLIGFLLAYIYSPFIHSQTPLAYFERQKATSAMLVGVCGTIFLLFYGWWLLRNREKAQ